jgi:hypothetical protein
MFIKMCWFVNYIKKTVDASISFIVVGRFTITTLSKSPRQIIWLFSSSALFNIKSKIANKVYVIVALTYN